MACGGLHCAGCAGGAAVPVVPLAAVFGLAWVAEHLIEVVIVSAACAVLAVAAVVALMRWGERRDARHAERWRFMVTREPSRPTLTATVTPQVGRTAPPAIEQHVHYHYHATGSREAARVFTAIPGQAGDAITGGK